MKGKKVLKRVMIPMLPLLLACFLFLSGCAAPETDWQIVYEAEALVSQSKEKAIEKCDESPNTHSKNVCLSHVAGQIALTDVDAATAICENMEPYLFDRSKDKCFFSVALHMDPSDAEKVQAVCDRIESYEQAKGCPLVAGSLRKIS